MLITVECLYCGYEWEKQIYSEMSMKGAKCSRCGDNLLRTKHPQDKVDYYAGAPEFKKEDDDGGEGNNGDWGGGFSDLLAAG